MQKDWKEVVKILKNDGVAVIPTDTLYGLVGSAFSSVPVEKIYFIKERDIDKPLIVLINSLKQLKKFGIKINRAQAKILKKFWPGSVSIILPCLDDKLNYIHRGTKSIAFRMIGKEYRNLYKLINSVGPLVAPSVNKESEKPAETIEQAKNYFGNNIDIYINEGERVSEPSTLIRIDNGNIEILRQGRTQIVV